MRRYGRATDGTIVAGKNAGLKLALSPQTECAEATVEECVVAIDGLYWFSDDSGAFDAEVEAAYLLPESQAAGPVLAIAKLTGELCGEGVTWSIEWTPEELEGPAPATLEDGAHLIVYPTATTAIGVLEVTAECDGESHGPILLSIVQYGCYYECTPNITDLIFTQWDDGADFSLENESRLLKIYSSATNPFNIRAELVGNFCSDCTVDWNIDDANLTLISATYSENSPIILLQIDPNDVGYLTVNATVTCGSSIFPGTGTFLIEFDVLEPI